MGSEMCIRDRKKKGLRLMNGDEYAVCLINTSYQKLPFGSGDDPDKLLFHQALN